MRKIIVLCSALVFGLCTNSFAWEVDFNDMGNEKFTPKLSLIAVQERMTKLKSVSGDSGTAERVFRQLYNDWFSNSANWTGQGRNSTIDKIQGYCSSNKLDDFEEYLKRIESKINTAIGDTAEIEGESTKEQQEQAIDFTDAIKENPKIQRGKLETAVNALEASLYTTGVNELGDETSPDMTEIDAAFASLDLTSLAKLWEQEGIGVDVDEDFIVSLKRAWRMQALNMSFNSRGDRYGKYDVEKPDYASGGTWVHLSDSKYNPNTFVDADGAGHAATFLLNHFRNTDTLKKISGDSRDIWDLRDVTGVSSDNPREPLPDNSTGDNGKILLNNLLYEFDRITDSDDKLNPKDPKVKMTFHLNLVSRLLTEISKEQDAVTRQNESAPYIKEYKVDSIVFHAFRQYMTQAFREAIWLIKAGEESTSGS